MNYRIRTDSMIFWSVVVALLSLSLTTGTATAKETPLAVHDEAAALNAFDYCRESARHLLVTEPIRVPMVTPDCARLTYQILAALRNAQYSPASYDLTSDRDRDRFFSGAAMLSNQEEDIQRTLFRLNLILSDAIVEHTFNQAISAYLWLDYGIDLRRDGALAGDTLGGSDRLNAYR